MTVIPYINCGSTGARCTRAIADATAPE